MPKIRIEILPAVPTAPAPLDAVTLDRVAREIAANVAAKMDRFYPGALTDRGLFNVKAWARAEVHRWFAPPEPGAPDMDRRLRASGAHRRHLKGLQTLAATVQPGDAIRLRHGAIGDGAFLLPTRQENLSRHILLQGHAGALRRRRRFRLRLCHFA